MLQGNDFLFCSSVCWNEDFFEREHTFRVVFERDYLTFNWLGHLQWVAYMCAPMRSQTWACSLSRPWHWILIGLCLNNYLLACEVEAKNGVMQLSFTFAWLREWLEPRIFDPVTNDDLSRQCKITVTEAITKLLLWHLTMLSVSYS
mgnify:CR=1 FL=1